MLNVTELRNGTVFQEDGNLYQVLSYEHSKLGRGSATIKVKVRNIRSGSTTDKSFINGARVQDVAVVKKDMQFLYKDEDSAYFMDPVSFEQVVIPLSVLEGSDFLREEMFFSVSFFQDEPLTLNLPPKMEFTVIETGPGVKGNSATNIYKDAILENNIKTKVPLFVNTGDRIRIDTRTGSYSEKAQ